MPNNKEIRMNNGTVRKVNYKKIERTNKFKIVTSVIVSSAILIGMLAGIIIDKFKSQKDYIIPSDKVKTFITLDIEKDDTISEIAADFYSDECKLVYESFSDYVDEIKKQNGISKFGDHIEPGEELEIPVIVDKKDKYYLAIQEIKNQIKDIEENHLWVKYVVKPGDSYTELAELASGSYEETYELYSKIITKNNVPSNRLREGMEIWIMNPKLGELKTQLREIEEQFKQSFVIEETKKTII